MAMRKREEEEVVVVVFPNAAGIDVGALSHWVVVLRYLAEARDEEPVREFGAMTLVGNSRAAQLLAGSFAETIVAGSPGRAFECYVPRRRNWQKFRANLRRLPAFAQ